MVKGGGLFSERDLSTFFIPPRYFWVQSLKAGEFPLWNPLNFGGHPFFATLQPAVLYPPNLLFFILPFNVAFNSIIIVHFFLAGAFTYIFLKFLGSGRMASFLGASIFLLGGYLLSVHSLLSSMLSLVWLPLILLFFAKALRHNSGYNAAWSGVLLTVSFLGGGIEIVLGTCGVLGLMAVFSPTFGGKRKFAILALLITAGVFLGLSSIQLFPFLELAIHSNRWNGLPYQEAITWSASPVDFISFLVPDLYGSVGDISKYWIRQSWLKTLYVGSLPFLLAIIYLIKEKRGKYFWIVLSALSVFLALGRFNPLYPYLYVWAPGVNKIRYPVKFLFLAVFALSVMAGIGLQRLLDIARRGEGKRFQWLVLIIATFASLFLLWLIGHNEGVLTFMKTAGIDSPTYNLATVNLYNFKRMLFYFVLACTVLWFVIKSRGSRFAVAMLCLILILDLFGNLGYYGIADARTYWADNWTTQQVKAGLGEFRTFTTPLTTSSTESWVAPNLKLFAEWQRVLTPSTNLNYGIRDMWGGEVMRVNRTDNLYNKLALTKSIDGSRIVDLFSTKYVISTRIISSPNFDLVGADIEGLKGDRERLLKENTIKIYRNKRVLPRWLIVKRYQVEANPASELELVSRNTFDPQRAVVLEERPIWDPRIRPSITEGPEDIKIENESNNRIELLANVTTPSFLYLADTYFPGWNAYVDGIKTKIYRANYNFRAVPLPLGDHHVEFRYEPLSFYVGAWISGITLLMLIAFGIRYLMLHRKGAAEFDGLSDKISSRCSNNAVQ